MHDPAILSCGDDFEIRINAFVSAANNHIFNEPAYFRLHASSRNDIYAQLVRVSNSKVYATVAFYETANNTFSSPAKGTFGGVGLNEETDLRMVDQFLRITIDHLRSLGGSSFTIKCPPFSHNPAQTAITSNILLRMGAAVVSHDLNYDLRMDDRPFLDRVDAGNAKRIRKCDREGFAASAVGPSAYGAAYQVIRENRQRRGFPLSMSLAQIEEMAAVFPDRIHFFAAYPDPKRSRIVAAAICIAISPAVLYVFYWGDAADMSAYSPVALLASHIYEFCRERSFSVFDVGTATVGGEPNYGLLQFKRNLGFAESLKLSFSLR